VSEQSGIVEALARSHLNPFAACRKGTRAAEADITRDFHDRHYAARHWAAAVGDIVEHARAAVARERLLASSTGNRTFWTQPARAALEARGFLNPGTNALSGFVVAAAATVRDGGHELRRLLATALSSISSHGLPAIACWVGVGFFVALPLLPELSTRRIAGVSPSDQTQPAASTEFASSEITMSFPEEKPPIGTNQQFNRMNLRYCIYQQVRLEAIGPVTYSTEADVFAALIKDWNARCSRFRFAAADKDAIDSEVKTRRPVLEPEGRALVRGWQRKIERTLQRLPTPDTPTAVTSSTASRAEGNDPLPSMIMLGRTAKNELNVGFNPLLKSPALVLLRPDSAMRVQERLNELGYTIGPADGNWGPTSRNALRRFKEANGLMANDGFDIETAVRLFSASASRAAAPTVIATADMAGTYETAYQPPPGASLNPLNRSDAVRIQQRLAVFGYYVGRFHGLWGVNSRKALHTFKAANDLADDDEWDAITQTVLLDEQSVRVAAAGADGAPATTSQAPLSGRQDPSTRSGADGKAVAAEPRQGKRSVPPVTLRPANSPPAR
jgi:peptidoglycan hydrolase-like protein with peptidoglycan-binding domain